MTGGVASSVRFQAVEKRFGQTIALHPLDLEIAPGTLFSLLGPSGCGKTTTLRLIGGFEQPTSGRIHIGERDVTGLPAYRRNFGMVFQSFALFPHLTVQENVAFGLQMRRVQKAQIRRKVTDALELVALSQLADRYPGQISGGQQQRVALARALVFEPDVLLLDEPLSALDKMLREQMQVEIRQLQKRLGTTTVFVTHDQEEALTMSDRVAVMNNGRVEQTGAPREIYERPTSEFVATFLGASNILTATVTGREADRLVVEIGGARMPVRGASASAGGKVKLALRPEKIEISQAAPVRARLVNLVYKGAQTHLDLVMGDQPITAVVANSAVEPLLLEVGTEIGLSWDPDSMVLLEK